MPLSFCIVFGIDCFFFSFHTLKLPLSYLMACNNFCQEIVYKSHLCSSVPDTLLSSFLPPLPLPRSSLVAQQEGICLQCRSHGIHGLNPWVRKIPWRRAWQPTPVFLPGESPWTEEPGGLQSIGLQRVGHDWSNLACMHYLSNLKVSFFLSLLFRSLIMMCLSVWDFIFIFWPVLLGVP